MKNIFSQFGSKKVAGVVLAGATLMVGLGVVSNFSGSNQKTANEAALSRFNDSAYNNFVGGSSASRADLERQMSATQDGYSARFLKGKSDGTEANEAFSSDGAYAEGVRSDEGFVYGTDGANGTNGAYGQNGAYNPFGSTYEQGTGGAEADYGTGNGAYGAQKFQEAQDAASAAGKGVKGNGGKGANGGTESAKAGGKGVRPATQINKLAASSGGSSFGGGAGGARGGGSASFAGGGNTGGDNSTRALPQASAGQTADGQAFKFGRAGGIGGFNTGFGGSEAKGGHSRGTGAASDLQMAALYSGKALASRQDVGQKSLAEAAFDGSNPEDIAPTIPEGASVGQVASNLLDANSMGGLPDALREAIGDLEGTLQETAEKAAELAALQKKLTWLKIAMIAGSLLFAIGIFFLRKIPGPWGYIAAGLASLALATFITGMGLWMKNVLDQMADPQFKAVNQGIDFPGKYTSIITTGLSTLATALYLGWSNKLGEIFQKVKKTPKVDLINTPSKDLFKVNLPKSDIPKWKYLNMPTLTKPKL